MMSLLYQSAARLNFPGIAMPGQHSRIGAVSAMPSWEETRSGDAEVGKGNDQHHKWASAYKDQERYQNLSEVEWGFKRAQCAPGS